MHQSSFVLKSQSQLCYHLLSLVARLSLAKPFRSSTESSSVLVSVLSSRSLLSVLPSSLSCPLLSQPTSIQEYSPVKFFLCEAIRWATGSQNYDWFDNRVFAWEAVSITVLMLFWLSSHRLLTDVHLDDHLVLLISISTACFLCFASLTTAQSHEKRTSLPFLPPT